MRRGWIIPVLWAALLTGCGYDDFGPLPENAGITWEKNVDIGYLRELCNAPDRSVLPADMVFSGRVVANDITSNFYRTFIIEDLTGAVEVKAGTWHLHNAYPLGLQVAVRAHGLKLTMADGVVQVGLPPLSADDPSSRYFGWEGALKERVQTGGGVQELSPRVLGIGELDVALCGRLVKVEGLTFDPGVSGDMTWAYPAQGKVAPRMGYRVFGNGNGGQITVVTSGYASFASHEIPAGKVSVTGILLYGKQNGSGSEKFMLKLRQEADLAAYPTAYP